MKLDGLLYVAGTGTALNTSSPILYFGQLMLKYIFPSAALCFPLFRFSLKCSIASMCLEKYEIYITVKIQICLADYVYS